MDMPKARGEQIIVMVIAVILVLVALYGVYRVSSFLTPDVSDDLPVVNTPVPVHKTVAQDPADPAIGLYEAKGVWGQQLLLYIYADGTCKSQSKYGDSVFEYENGISSWQKVGDHYEVFTERAYVDKPIYMELTPDGIGFPNTGLDQYYYDKNNVRFWPMNFTKIKIT